MGGEGEWKGGWNGAFPPQISPGTAHLPCRDGISVIHAFRPCATHHFPGFGIRFVRSVRSVHAAGLSGGAPVADAGVNPLSLSHSDDHFL